MGTINSTAELMELSIKITEGMEVHYTFQHKTEKITLPEASPLTYNIDSKRITFVDKDGNIFATTDISGVEELLIAEGYKKDEDMYVFFAWGSYPVAFKEEWETIIALAAVNNF